MFIDESEDPQWAVIAIDMACDCCSYVAVASFDSRADAEAYVARKDDRNNYMIEEF